MSQAILQKVRDSEESYLNTTYWDIYPLYLLVQTGDVNGLDQRLDIQLERFPAGRISRDARKQLEYLTVSLVNAFMIAAIQGGVYPPEANAVADIALRRLSRFRNVSELPEIIREAAMKLCGMVSDKQRTDTGNPHVERARQYISSHLTQEIRMEDIARTVGVSASHLSHLFKSLTGVSVREYLISERVSAAKQLLLTTDYSIPQIAALLRFCDQSYFTMVFRKRVGATPRQYREGRT